MREPEQVRVSTNGVVHKIRRSVPLYSPRKPRKNTGNWKNLEFYRD